MKLTPFETALRARFKTPQAALRCLGIDENILNEDRSKQMKRARDQEASTVEEILDMIDRLPEEQRLELLYQLNGTSGEGEDVRGRRRRARDAEWDMEGPPKVGPTEEVGGLEDRDRRDAQDRRRRSMGQDAAQDSRDFFDRFPGAARIKVV